MRFKHILVVSAVASIALVGVSHPTAAHAATAAITCKDGTTSNAKTTKGACSGHGGVAATKTTAVVTKTTVKTSSSTTVTVPKGATAMCKDNSYSMSKTHSGACSSHGGVAKWL